MMRVTTQYAWLGIRTRHVVWLILLSLGSALSEGLGIGMMLPVLELVERQADVAQLALESTRWRILVSVYDRLHLPITLFTLLIPVCGLVVVRQVFSYARLVYTCSLRERITSQIQRKGFEAFARADLGFVLNTGVGRLLNAMTVDGQRAGAVVHNLFDFLALTTLIGVYFVVLIAASGGVAIVAALVLGGIYLVLQRLLAWSRRFGQTISEQNERLSRASVELLGGMRLVKLANREEDAVDQIGRIVDRLRDQTVAAANIGNRVHLLVEPIAMLLLLAALFIGVQLFGLSLAKIGLFGLVVIRLVPLIRSALDNRQSMASHLASYENVTRLISQAERCRTIRGGAKRFSGLAQELRCEGVSFRYPETVDDALHALDLSIPARRMSAIVGRSGAGKSTLVDLIPRLIEPTTGRILVDGVPLEESSLESLRRQVAFVPQEGILFDDTIASNIRYERPAATDEEVRQAARMARAEEFILRLPRGYETVVGERGVRLSIGQRQRISLARALLKRASILILDEPTSALDLETEQGVQEALDALRQEGKTTLIVIAHRLSTIYRADLIVVLDQGRLVESGTHAQLMHNDEWYARILDLQLLPEALTAQGSHG